MQESKPCSRCKQIKPFTEFNKKASAPTGYNSACRECANAMKRNLTPEQRARKNKKNREYRASNPEVVKATNHQQYLNKREVRIEAAYIWKEANREKLAAYNSKWAAKNREKINEYAHRRRAMLRNNQSFLILDKELKRLYESDCYACGSNNDMTIEHLIPLKRGGNHGIGNLIALCKSCNSSKHIKLWMEWRVWRKKRGKPPLPAYAQTTRAFQSFP